MRALIVDDGRSLGALAAVRSLSRAGWQVGVAAPDRRGFAASSRHVWRHHTAPLVHVDLPGFVDAVRSAISADAYELVFTGGDAELMALSHARGQLGASLPYAEHEVVELALDKLHLHRLGLESGLASPVTEPSDAISGWTSWPVVVKARKHWTPEAGGAGRLDASVCADPSEARRRIEEIAGAGGEAIVQESVSGVLMAYTVLCEHGGRVVAAVQQEVDGLDPSPPGSSTRARTVPVDPGLASGVQRLMLRLGWFGVAELQFMKRTGEEPRLIDLNGRFYGSMSLAIASGIDLPALWARVALGSAVPRRPAREQVRYQWFHGDLLRAVEERRGGLLHDLAKTFSYGWGAVHPLWSRSDVRPALRYLMRAPQRIATMVTGR